MNLAQSNEQRLLAYCQAMAHGEMFSVPDLGPYRLEYRLTRAHLRVLVSRLEKRDQLVRLHRGLYMTMVDYQQSLTKECADAPTS